MGSEKGTPDFNDVRSRAVEREDEIRGGFQVGVTGGDKGDEGLPV
jgi:hypothetical protein